MVVGGDVKVATKTSFCIYHHLTVHIIRIIFLHQDFTSSCFAESFFTPFDFPFPLSLSQLVSRIRLETSLTCSLRCVPKSQKENSRSSSDFCKDMGIMDVGKGAVSVKLLRPGTLTCILCRGVVQYKNNNKVRFVKHMENEHAAYFDLDFILATCFMDEDEKAAVKNVIQNKNVDSDEDGVEEVTVTEIAVKTEVHPEPPKETSKRERKDEPSKESEAKKAKVETISKSFDCRQCDEKFSNSKDLEGHVQAIHTNSGSIPCDQCNEQFLSNEDLRKHTTSSHSSTLEPFECPQCEEKFDNREQLKSHIKKTFHSKKTEFFCKLCDQYFCRKDALRIHKGRKHNGELPEYMTADARRERRDKGREKKKTSDEKVASNSKRTTPQEIEPQDVLERTEHSETGDDNKLKLDNNDCKQCSSKFSSIGNLKKHERKFHVDQWNLDTTSQFSCQECVMKYTSMAALTNHNKWKHGELGSGTNPEEQVEQSHEPVAEVQSGLRCPTCEKSFTRKDNMNKHIKTKHQNGGEKRQTEQVDELNINGATATDTTDYWTAKMAELEKATEAHVKAGATMTVAVDTIDTTKANIKADPDSSKTTEPDSGLFVATNIVKCDPDPLSATESMRPPDYSRQDVTKSKYFRMNSYAICDMQEYTEGAEVDFTDCFDLPQGWKYRFCGPKDNPEKSTHFITPDKKVIKSRLGAIEYLRMTGSYRRKKLWEFATCLHVPEKRFEKLF